MNAEKVLQLVTQSRFDELRALAEQEVRTNAAKRRGGTTEAKRQKAAEKLIKDMAANKPSMAGAMYYGGTQYITNGFVCAALPEGKHLEIAPADVQMENMPQWFSPETSAIALDWAALEAAYKMHVAQHGRGQKAPKCTVQLGEQYFNAALLLDGAAIMGGDCAAAHENNWLSPLHLRNDNGECVVLPIRPTDQCKVEAINITGEG